MILGIRKNTKMIEVYVYKLTCVELKKMRSLGPAP